MFTSIINSFLRSGPATLEQKMLNLELLVYNFHESLNLKPLFLHLEREMKVSPTNRAYLIRLYQVADEVTRKQMLVIAEGGERFDATIDTKTLGFPSASGEGESPATAHDIVVEGIRRNVKLEVLAADPVTEQLQVRTTLRSFDGGRVDTSSTEFWVGHFDFPMIDNTRLPRDQRLAVVLNNFDAKRGVADVTVVCYPGKYAALREKPYYDEVLANLLAANRSAASSASDVRTPAQLPK
ncbi:MAG: hypothetical protein M3167_03315 [Acidobacteriota bacterium]|nr:hypothetical protein [Acidobacteriota bacterium]